MDYLVVIPATYKSPRFPVKPLLKIRCIPMIIQTFKRCQKIFPNEKIEDIEILKFLEIGYQVDMVKPKGKPFSIYTKEDLKRANNL